MKVQCAHCLMTSPVVNNKSLVRILRHTVVVHTEFSTHVLIMFLCRHVLFLLTRSVVMINSGSVVQVKLNFE